MIVSFPLTPALSRRKMQTRRGAALAQRAGLAAGAVGLAELLAVAPQDLVGPDEPGRVEGQAGGDGLLGADR